MFERWNRQRWGLCVDDLTLNAGSGGSVLAADDIASVFYQRTKLSLGADGTAVDAVAGAGAVSTGVQRVTLASDDPAVTALQVIDDWDESDRAKVNPIVGVAGVAAGAGAVGTTTQRTTLASDDPAVVAVQIMDDWDESDRAKVNPIVGQAGVAAGAGAVAATVQRVTLASDDPAVVAAQLIDDAIVADDAAFTPATTKVMMAGFEFDDTTPDTVNEGDAGAARMSSRRELYVQVRDAAGNERGLNVDASGQVAVTAASLPLPSGAASAANQSTEITALAAIQTAVEVLDNTVSGSEMQVDVVGALPAGTNAIGKLAANSGVDIGDVDVTTVVPGTGATSLGKAVDAVAGATDTGVAALAVRDDALGALTPVEGDYVTLRTDANGALWTHDDALDAALSGSELQVDIVGALPAGTNAIGKLAANSGVDIGDVDVLTLPNVTLAAGTNTNEVVGDAAHDAAVAGNPVLVSGAAQNMDDTAPPNRVSAESDATRLATDWDGAIFAHPHGPQVWSYHVDGSSALTDTQVHAAPGAGLSLYVTDIVIASGAGTAINVFFEEGASKVLGPYYLEAVAGRGCALHFQTPKKITANTALTVTSSAAIAHAIDVTGFVGQG